MAPPLIVFNNRNAAPLPACRNRSLHIAVLECAARLKVDIRPCYRCELLRAVGVAPRFTKIDILERRAEPVAAIPEKLHPGPADRVRLPRHRADAIPRQRRYPQCELVVGVLEEPEPFIINRRGRKGRREV